VGFCENIPDQPHKIPKQFNFSNAARKITEEFKGLSIRFEKKAVRSRFTKADYLGIESNPRLTRVV
jgi:hypothetical protein